MALKSERDSGDGSGAYKLTMPAKGKDQAPLEMKGQARLTMAGTLIPRKRRRERAARKRSDKEVRLEARPEEICYSLGHSDGAEDDFFDFDWH